MNNLCVTLFQMGETEKAMDCFREAAEKFPESAIASDNYKKAANLQKREKSLSHLPANSFARISPIRARRNFNAMNRQPNP